MTVRVIYPSPAEASVSSITWFLISDGSPLWLRNVHVIQFGTRLLPRGAHTKICQCTVSSCARGAVDADEDDHTDLQRRDHTLKN